MESFRGVVYPAQTDAMGHMTVQYYVAAFDQAMWHFVTSLGYDPELRVTARQGWADVRYEIDFRKELTAGDLFVVTSSLVSVGNSSLVSHHRMHNGQGAVMAEIEMRSVYFDLATRASMRLPDGLRANCLAALAAQGTPR